MIHVSTALPHHALERALSRHPQVELSQRRQRPEAPQSGDVLLRYAPALGLGEVEASELLHATQLRAVHQR